jgi:hypothetical protein
MRLIAGEMQQLVERAEAGFAAEIRGRREGARALCFLTHAALGSLRPPFVFRPPNSTAQTLSKLYLFAGSAEALSIYRRMNWILLFLP